MIITKLSTLLIAIKKKRVKLIRFCFRSFWDRKDSHFIRVLDSDRPCEKVLIKAINELKQNMNLVERVYYPAYSAFYTGVHPKTEFVRNQQVFSTIFCDLKLN